MPNPVARRPDDPVECFWCKGTGHRLTKGFENEPCHGGCKGTGKQLRSQREEDEHLRWCLVYGSAPYGGWRIDPLDGRNKPHQVIEEAGRIPR